MEIEDMKLWNILIKR